VSPPSPLPFEHLLAPIRQAGLLEAAAGDLQTPIGHLAHDSRLARPGTCFFALPGALADGHAFIDAAVQRGATAVVCERPPDAPLPELRAIAHVSNARAAMAEVAAVFYGRPSEALRLLGVTGTNGKTTVSYLLHEALTALGEKAGLIGTIEVRSGGGASGATHTTPDALALNDLLATMVANGCSSCAIEVSSHALDQHRVRGQRFDVAVFTNLTHDHLDYHGSVEAYRAAKAMLFASLGSESTAIVNRDDPSWPFMVENTAAKVVTFGRAASGEADTHSSTAADIVYRIDRNLATGLRLAIDGSEPRRFRLAGAFNAANLAAAYATLRAIGYGQAETLDALAEAPPVPGRLETIRPSDVGGDASGPIVVVDYAHTPDALDNVLQTVREMVPAGGALAVVFGCGGDRDRAKRPVMGRLAAELADRVILTNDNPRTENPATILAEIAGGMPSPPDGVYLDRTDAIRAAIDAAGPQDVVVIAGKGHETYQIVGTERRHFDDRETTRDLLRLRQPGAGN
jgi:UDP-N-acetylmuramoyl-L-alanyl-D-glutamate--2,6-diaminopimelate ligase